MACGTVDDGAVGDVLAVVDKNSPDVDEKEQSNVGELLQRKEEGEDVIRKRLSVSVERMEGMRCEWTGHDPFVVRLVEGFVDGFVVQAAVNPVNAEIRERDKEGKLQAGVPPTKVPC